MIPYVREVQYFPLAELPLGVVGQPPSLALRSTWPLDDAFAQQHRDKTIELRGCDPETGEAREDLTFTPARRSHWYVLRATSAEGEDLLRRLGTTDVHVLCRRCLKVLRAYVEFYKQQIASAGR